jgi:hypothetical protein
MSQKKHCYQLTDAERDTLRTLVAEAIAEGSYYGNREQYRARLVRIDSELLKHVAVTP